MSGQWEDLGGAVNHVEIAPEWYGPIPDPLPDGYIVPADMKYRPENLKNYRVVKHPKPGFVNINYYNPGQDGLKRVKAEGGMAILVKGQEREFKVDIHKDLKEPVGTSLYKYCRVMVGFEKIALVYKGEMVPQDQDLTKYEFGEEISIFF